MVEGYSWGSECEGCEKLEQRLKEAHEVMESVAKNLVDASGWKNISGATLRKIEERIDILVNHHMSAIWHRLNILEKAEEHHSGTADDQAGQIAGIQHRLEKERHQLQTNRIPDELTNRLETLYALVRKPIAVLPDTDGQIWIFRVVDSHIKRMNRLGVPLSDDAVEQMNHDKVIKG